MRKRILLALATAPALLVPSVGVAGSATAAEGWVMPNLRGEVLQTAISDIHGITGDAELNMRYIPTHVNQNVYNFTNWAVCAQTPSPGKEISQKTKRVVLYVRRLNEKC